MKPGNDNNPVGQFCGYLDYKPKRIGALSYENEAYTTQGCPVCGHRCKPAGRTRRATNFSMAALQYRLRQLFDYETMVTVCKYKGSTADDVHRACRIGISRRVDQQKRVSLPGGIQVHLHHIVAFAQASHKACMLVEVVLRVFGNFLAREQEAIRLIVAAGHQVSLYLLGVGSAGKSDHQIPDRIKDAEILRLGQLV